MTLPEPIDLGVTRIGFLSDSHGDAQSTRRAVAALVDAGAQALIHLGDVCADDVLEELIVSQPDGGGFLPARTLVGNMDLYPDEFRATARSLDIPVDDPIGVYRAGGKLIVAQHGHHRAVDRLAREAGADFFIQGHTHKVRDDATNGIRNLNPGALHRAERYTCALLDVESGEFSVLDVGKAVRP